MPEQSTAVVEVPTSKLMRLLASVKPFVSTDDMLPMINAVSFEFAGEDLIVTGTDRYTLGVSRLAVGQTIIAPPRVLRLADVTRIESSFRPAKGADPELRLTFGDEGLTVETSRTLDGKPTHTEVFEWYAARFPEWRKLIPEEVTGGGVAALNPAFLVKFTKVPRDGDAESIVISAAGFQKPWKVTIGDHFLGLIMPVKLDEGTSAWSPAGRNEVPAPAAEPAPKPRTSRSKKAAA